MTAQVITVLPQQRVLLKKEYKARKHHGDKIVAWVVQDKLGQHLIASGKLAYIVSFINSLVDQPCDKVNLPGLYETCALRHDSSRTGGWHKHRWKVTCHPLEDAPSVIERLRSEHAHGVVLASPGVCTVV
jgi:hypothetical protein